MYLYLFISTIVRSWKKTGFVSLLHRAELEPLQHCSALYKRSRWRNYAAPFVAEYRWGTEADVIGKGWDTAIQLRESTAYTNKQFRRRENNTETQELTNHAVLCRNDQDSTPVKSERIKQTKGHTKLHIKKKSSGAKKKKKKNYLEIKPSNMKTMSVDPLCYQILIFISE